MGKLKSWAKGAELAPLGLLLVATLGCIALGVLFGWILFGRPHLITKPDKIGTIAEWIAAIATSIVGIGAWKYAREGHLLRVEERYFSELESAERRRAELLAIIGQLVPAGYPLHNVDGLIGIGAGISKAQFRDDLEQIVELARPISLTQPEQALLDKDSLIAYGQMNNSLRGTSRIANLIMRGLENADVEQVQGLFRDVEKLRVAASLAEETSSAAIEGLHAVRNKIRIPDQPPHMRSKS